MSVDLNGYRVISADELKTRLFADNERYSFFYRLRDLINRKQKFAVCVMTNNGLKPVDISDLVAKSQDKNFTDLVNKRFKQVLAENTALVSSQFASYDATATPNPTPTAKRKKVLLTLVLDISGSMSGGPANSMYEGVNKLLKDNNDDVTDTDVNIIWFNKLAEPSEIKNIKEFKYERKLCKAYTALNDAILSALDVYNKHGNNYDLNHIFVFTDGEENASSTCRFTVKEKLAKALKNSNLKVNLMGQDDSQIKLYAQDIGLLESTNTYNLSKIDKVFEKTSNMVFDMRTQVSRGLSVNNTYTPEQIAAFSKI